MAILSVGYFLLALLLDYALAAPWLRKKFVRGGKAATSASAQELQGEDSDVAAERQRIAAEGGRTEDVLSINVRAVLASGVDGPYLLLSFRCVLLKSVVAPLYAVHRSTNHLRVASLLVVHILRCLRLQSLRKQYGSNGKVAVKSLAFGVPIGQCFGFLGINGAGKTTTLKILSGEILPSSGSASIAGFDILTQQMQLRRLLGCVFCMRASDVPCLLSCGCRSRYACRYCPQFDALYDLLTVREHLELFARIKGIEEPKIPQIVASLITLMDLTKFEHKRAGTLSGGNKRKLSVAVALIGEPPVVFLGEWA